MRPFISLCMIAKNEEQNLPACLEAAVPQVDEIIIVDTGSTDQTSQVAARYGARIIDAPWQDHFSHARNTGIEYCSGEFILVLDADEIIETHARTKLLAFSTLHPNQCGSLCISSPYLSDGKTLTKSAEVRRFFPNHPDFRFQGRIHEQVSYKGEPASYKPTGVEVLHNGYHLQEKLLQDKFERNRFLLEKAVEESPQDAYMIFQLGRTYLGAKKYAEAAAWLSKALELTPPTYRHYASAVVDHGYALKGLKRYEEAIDHCVHHMDILPDYPDLYLLLAFILMEEGSPKQIETMLACFEKCLSLNGTPIPYETVQGATTFLPSYHIGLFFELMGDPSTARSYYTEAAKYSFEPAINALMRIR